MGDATSADIKGARRAMDGFFPEIDASRCECITEAHAAFFREHGVLLLRNVVRGEELAQLQAQTLGLVEQARAGVTGNEDFQYKSHSGTGERVPYLVDHVVEKSSACQRLMGHPFILRTVEALQGRAFIPTWDSLVFKNPGMGAEVPWHRDADWIYPEEDRRTPVFNVDFYLDASDLSNCLWCVPGSNRWSKEEATRELRRLGGDGFKTQGAIPVPMRPGDVLLHDILVLHGSASAQTGLRRVVYFEYRPIKLEAMCGPHTPAYIPVKQQVLARCLKERAGWPGAAGERAYVYRPGERWPVPAGEPARMRVTHEAYWRQGVAMADIENQAKP